MSYDGLDFINESTGPVPGYDEEGNAVEGKYITFKHEDFDELLSQIAHVGLTPQLGEILNRLAEREVEDAVVIRRQDMFAPPALDAYANSIMTSVEILKEDGDPTGRAEHLQGVADYFSEQAALSWGTHRKLPD